MRPWINRLFLVILLFVSASIYEYIFYMHLHICMYIVCACCMCVLRPEHNCRCFLFTFSQEKVWDSLSPSWNSPSRLDWLASKPQGSAYLCSASMHATMPDYFWHGIWGLVSSLCAWATVQWFSILVFWNPRKSAGYRIYICKSL